MASGGYLTQESVDEFWDYKKTLINYEFVRNLDFCKYDEAVTIKNGLYTTIMSIEYDVGCIVLKEFEGKPIDKKIALIFFENREPKFISIGSTYTTADGEYRAPFMKYEFFMGVMKKYDQLLSTQVEKLIKHHKFTLLEEGLDHVKDVIDPFYVFVLVYGSRNNKSSKDHRIIDFANDIVYDNVIEYKDVSPIIFSLSHYEASERSIIRRARTLMGCKIIPLTINNMNSFGNLTDKVWCEIYIGLICNDLIINGNCSHLPFLYNKTYTSNKKFQNVYDLPSNYIKLKHSDLSFSIQKDLLAASNKTKMDDIYISYEFENIDEGIHDVINLSDQSILSDNSICLIMTHRGPSLDEALNIALNNKIEPIILSSNIFELAYTLYTLNINGIIHNDLHLNNVTVKTDNIFHNKDEMKGKNSVIYAIPSLNGKKKDIVFTFNENSIYRGEPPFIIEETICEQILFCFNAPNHTFSIIDFSRAFIKKELDDEHNQMLFDSAQRDKLRETYKNLFPDYYKKNKTVVESWLKDLDTNFDRFAAMDMYRFSTLLEQKLLDQSTKHDLDIMNDIVSIKNAMEDYLLSDKPRPMNPNRVIMEMYDLFKVKDGEVIKDEVSNIYVSDAPHIYTVENYDKLPPMYKLFTNTDNDLIYPLKDELKDEENSYNKEEVSHYKHGLMRYFL